MNRALGLRVRLLWLKHAWSFNWAHKPLCERFRENVLRIGPLRVCRSCTCVYAGVGLAGGTLLMTMPGVRAWMLAVLVALLATVFAGSMPRVYGTLPRLLRDALRFGAGALFALATYVGLAGSPVAGLAALSLIYAFWRVYFSRRARRKLRECDGCPELCADRICSGFAAQAEHVRAYQREATELLYSNGGAALPGFTPRRGSPGRSRPRRRACAGSASRGVPARSVPPRG